MARTPPASRLTPGCMGQRAQHAAHSATPVGPAAPEPEVRWNASPFALVLMHTRILLVLVALFVSVPSSGAAQSSMQPLQLYPEEACRPPFRCDPAILPRSAAHAQAADSFQRRSSNRAEIVGGILGSAVGLAAGGLLGLNAESTSGCASDICGAGGLVGGMLGGTLGAAGGAYLAGRSAGHSVSFPRALGGATLGMLVFGGLSAAVLAASDGAAFPILLVLPIGQGLLTGGFAQNRPQAN